MNYVLFPAETEVVEFKEAKQGYDFSKLGKYFSALSNEANLMGKEEAWLVLGVENKKKDIIGSQFRSTSRPYLDSLKGEIANKTTNGITFIEIHNLIYQKAELLCSKYLQRHLVYRLVLRALLWS